ncbi:DUF3332 domain-containing protein [Acidiluteibacter ferrifornacis]|uniref:DUF3332 family protein n=1 Tax=Acidiluteibacter ferrifornacis TaxID=2692424 RepID=A0A6N9NJM2_9FLAO|nr:DUF3332 domain-containing protein [Acidiluteibacter ferrifornacis]NBG65390.1 DUF3332 family protein [Acidiluteibacter ferrifornacis]
MKKIVFSAMAAMIMITQTGCFGSFELVKKVYDFNDNITSSKFVNTLVFYVFTILPVYSIASFIDVVILNLVEFWTGSNPLAMTEGQIEEQLVTYKGEVYKMTATKNKFHVEKLNGTESIEVGNLVFADEARTWSFEKNGESTPIATLNADNSVTYHVENGTATVYNNDMETLVFERNTADHLIEMASK